MRQISKTKRRLAAGAFLITAGPVALGSVAYACQSLATLHANPVSVAAGSTVAINGRNYARTSASGAQPSAIEIRLDTRTGPLLATIAAPPASPTTGAITGNVVIPAGTSIGAHTLLALQTNSSGNPQSGTPGRASIQVTVAARSTGQAGAPASAATVEPVAATPAAATPADAAPAAAAVASRDAAAPATATATGTAPVAAPAAAAATGAAAQAVDATTAGAAATQTATPALAASDTPAGPAPAAGASEVSVGLQPASSGSSNSLMPGLTLAVGLALVVLSLGAFLKSGRNLFGSAPLA